MSDVKEARRQSGHGEDMALWRMAMYGLPALPMAFLYIPVPLMVPAFYAEQFGLSLSVVGGFLFVSRAFDMLIDPALGRLSDTTRSRWGRRRPWMVIGAPIMMLGTALIFMPPDWANGLYLMVASMVIYFGASMLGLAYSAWGAEVVDTYHGRSKLAGFRETFNIIGILLAVSIPAITALYGHGLDRYTMSIMGWAAILMTPPAIWAAIRWVPEPPSMPKAPAEKPWWPTVKDIFGNFAFRYLCIGFVVLSIGSSIASATLIFYVSYYLGQPELIGPVLLVSFIAVLLFVPVWVKISRRIGKHKAVAYSLFIAIICSSCVAFQLRPGDGWLFVGLMGVLGGASSAFLTLPVGIMGDVIDYDALKTGEQRGGIYFGIWAFAQQIAPALAVGTALPMLDWLGFSASQDNSPEALDALRYVYCLAPLPFYVIAAVLLLWFPLDDRRHGIIRRRLERRRLRKARIQASPDW
ncbi:MFS transporter [Parasphingopyxis marina]|uniref:MFS transporter n=1 Tax=Parasphingopyxis marina TaxID=2761622 RepID=A0A842I1Y7_9SPHN|nr:MFS transporter [Parasphingopyxis marina]MBC2778947.1 MFS transporter [Parasphingopyxis marina]